MISLEDFSLPEFDPDKYIIDAPLLQAAQLAIALNQPLLLTGAPGTGKTKLAWKLADILHKAALESDKGSFERQPLEFHTKTSSVAKDLFYMYDAVSHFQTANIKKSDGAELPKTEDFIELKALGLAIAKTNPEQVADHLPFKKDVGDKATGTVVLIDEIDKAPRDFPNDILHEIDNYEFSVKELNQKYKKGKGQRIMVIMTSNSEKNLPQAFLRRCVFYHIPFPDDKKLLKIAQSQLGKDTKFTKEMLSSFIAFFRKVRKHSNQKKPATAELIAWLRILEMQEIFDPNDTSKMDQLKNNLSVLVKTREDMDLVEKELF